ncbi:hypothetical protein JHD50_02305 [Sulfurimonas sp. MAG313]|nr:hypothetical protein [Sulfurimonas sp. MAG313]MDF1880144.1 hypothetical protein [Sulfurimonas sp. MAG313]
MVCVEIKECGIKVVKDIEISWPSNEAIRLANAILHTYQMSEYEGTEFEIPIETICKFFNEPCTPESAARISALVDEILAEPVAVMNKVLDRKVIIWKTYDFFTLLMPIHMSSGFIKLNINLDYLRITKEFVVNPYLEF